MAHKKKSKAGKAKRKQPRPRPRETLEDMLILLPSIFDNIIEEVEPEERRTLAEEMVQQSVVRLAKTLDMPPERFMLLMATDKTMRLLNAIQAHAEQSGKDGDAVIDKLIATLGSKAATNFLMN